MADRVFFRSEFSGGVPPRRFHAEEMLNDLLAISHLSREAAEQILVGLESATGFLKDADLRVVVRRERDRSSECRRRDEGNSRTSPTQCRADADDTPYLAGGRPSPW